MKKFVGEANLMIKCCKLYYEENLTQNEIATILGVSRPTISRLLDEGRKSGVVKIEIVNPIENNYGILERNIEKKYSLREVIIVDDDKDDDAQKKNLAKACAEYLKRIVKMDDNIGVSMGTTIKNIGKYIEPNSKLNLTLIPLIGGVGQTQIEIHPNHVVMDLARAFRGDFKLLHAPAVVSNGEIRNTFLKEESLENILEMGKKVDIAIVGIGSPITDKSTMMSSGYFDVDDLKVFKKQGAAGDICLQFYDINGQSDEFEFNNRVIGVELDNIKKIPTVIGVAGGEEKIEAIVGALNGKFINVLVTNYSNAKAIYDQF
ncbi:sugar-binding transcriptional regulator [Clostridium intestinale]|uniref:DNA-binding transcriptional regulator LsrR, DeoR family n=1 Tax=Clostridium intestinale DSM 6191 TaxID=1121320 RepID=A0A1M6C7C1_9CLOT|nr:sugar-binding transcriptional regulator [Clostridium intestinale]SHI56947.1 DNA-binding transcriptional regulator LsrR, DeoR family [Clostridium intestinale DSM 6191]